MPSQPQLGEAAARGARRVRLRRDGARDALPTHAVWPRWPRGRVRPADLLRAGADGIRAPSMKRGPPTLHGRGGRGRQRRAPLRRGAARQPSRRAPPPSERQRGGGWRRAGWRSCFPHASASPQQEEATGVNEGGGVNEEGPTHAAWPRWPRAPPTHALPHGAQPQVNTGGVAAEAHRRAGVSGSGVRSWAWHMRRRRPCASPTRPSSSHTSAFTRFADAAHARAPPLSTPPPPRAPARCRRGGTGGLAGREGRGGRRACWCVGRRGRWSAAELGPREEER
jgi:hypothetical protein